MPCEGVWLEDVGGMQQECVSACLIEVFLVDDACIVMGTLSIEGG